MANNISTRIATVIEFINSGILSPREGAQLLDFEPVYMSEEDGKTTAWIFSDYNFLLKEGNGFQLPKLMEFYE